MHRLTLRQLVEELARRPLAERGWKAAGRLVSEAVAARVTAEAWSRLQYFQPVARTPGFAPALVTTLLALRTGSISPDRLAGTLGPRGEDLRLLQISYEKEMRERRIADWAERIRLATETVRAGAHRLCGLPVVLLDVQPENPAEEKLLKEYLKKSPEVIELTTPAESDTPADALRAVQRGLFSVDALSCPHSPAGFEVFTASGESLECVEIARRVREAAERGVRFDEIAILLRHPERYQPMVEEALARTGIPAYFSLGSRRPDPAGRAFLSLLLCAEEGLSASRFAEYLSLSQVPEQIRPTSQEPEEEPEEGSDLYAPIRWERMLVDAAVIGGLDRWEQRLEGLSLQFQTALDAAIEESARMFYATQLKQLALLRDFALPMIGKLANLPRKGLWGDWLRALADLAEAGLRHPHNVLALLEELEPMSDVGPVDLPEVLLVLGKSLGQIRRESKKTRYGAVFVGNIPDARGLSFRVVFVPGLCEGSFPAPLHEDPLLLDAHWQALAGALPADREEGERSLLRICALSATEQLVLSYPRIELDTGRERVPSFYLFEAVRAARGQSVDIREFIEQTQAAAEARVGWPAPHDPGRAIDDAEFDLATLRPAFESPDDHAGTGCYLTEANGHLVRSMRRRWRRWNTPGWTYDDGLVVGQEIEALQVLNQHSLKKKAYSATALQEFSVCPYRFALAAIHGLRPAEQPEAVEAMDPQTRGEIYHRTQFRLLNSLRENALLPVHRGTLEDALRHLDAALDEVAETLKAERMPAIPQIWDAEVESLRTDLKGWLAEQASLEPDWAPVAFELSLGRKRDPEHDPASSEQPVRLFDEFLLQGSIDVVERKGEGPLRVTDYKTGRPPQPAPVCVGKGTYLQPLLYALAAEKIFHAPVLGGRLYYSTLRGNYRKLDIPLDDVGRQHVRQVLETIERAISEGMLPALPDKDACKACDYLPVCGPYEAERTERKRKWRPLVELRRLP